LNRYKSAIAPLILTPKRKKEKKKKKRKENKGSATLHYSLMKTT
jgi:hypothetical protein